jgi:hypothetical protein
MTYGPIGGKTISVAEGHGILARARAEGWLPPQPSYNLGRSSEMRSNVVYVVNDMTRRQSTAARNSSVARQTEKMRPPERVIRYQNGRPPDVRFSPDSDRTADIA